MSLQTHFAVLLGLLVLTLAGILGIALRFGVFLERELIWPHERTLSALQGLETLKRASGDLTAILPGPGRDEPGSEFFAGESPDAARASQAAGAGTHPAALAEAAARYAALSGHVEAALRKLEQDPEFSARVGVSTAGALSAQVASAREVASRWFESGDVAVGVEAGLAHYRIHELIEAVERRLIAEAPEARVYANRLRRIHETLLLSGGAATLLFCVLFVMLFRRWVIVPVRDLREATARLGRGEFEHRVPVRSADELGRLSEEVNRMAGTIASMQAEAVEREKLAAAGEVVRRLAHNIRNPLAAIRSLAELSARRVGPEHDARQNLNEITACVDRFDRWLTDLLGVGAPTNIVVVRTPARPWLENLVASQRTVARTRGVEIVADLDGAPDWAWFDQRHLEHALIAVISNAVQASPEGGVVRVRANRAGQAGWEVVVADEGPGIQPEVRPRLFKPYFTTKRDGTGIGLAFALQVVKGHGGEIGVESSPGHGAEFVFRLPLAPAGAPQPADSSRTAEHRPRGA